MTRRENTIFYHEQSVEIPKEEPFLCSNTLSCLDYAAQQLDVCIQNTSVSGKYSISGGVIMPHNSWFNIMYQIYLLGSFLPIQN